MEVYPYIRTSEAHNTHTMHRSFCSNVLMQYAAATLTAIDQHMHYDSHAQSVYLDRLLTLVNRILQ